MTDERDFSWLGRPVPPPPPPVEHPLWTLEKAGHQAAARVRATDFGPEVRILIDGELWWSQQLRPATEAALRDVADRKRAEFLARGWVDAAR